MQHAIHRCLGSARAQFSSIAQDQPAAQAHWQHLQTFDVDCSHLSHLSSIPHHISHFYFLVWTHTDGMFAVFDFHRYLYRCERLLEQQGDSEARRSSRMQARMTFSSNALRQLSMHASDTKRGFDSSLANGPHGIGGGATHSSGSDERQCDRSRPLARAQHARRTMGPNRHRRFRGPKRYNRRHSPPWQVIA